MATKTEHWTQRVPRELREVKAMNEMLLGFVEVKGLMAEWKDYSDKTAMSVFTSASGSGDPPQKSGKKPSGGDPDGGDDGSDGDGEGSDDQDGDPFENQSDSEADDYIQISVVKQFNTNSKNVSKVFTVSSSWTVGSLKWMIWCKWKIPVNHQIYLFSNGDQVLEHLTFAQNGVRDNSIIYLQLGLCGGTSKKRRATLSEMRLKETDPDMVKACFGIESFNDMAWLHHLDLNALKEYKKAIESSRGVANQVQFTVDKIQEMKALKDSCFLEVRVSRPPSLRMFPVSPRETHPRETCFPP